MLSENPLTLSFVQHHPIDAARVLEKLSPEYSVAFMQAIDEKPAARLFHYFMPGYAARCLSIMEDRLLNVCGEHTVSDLCRALLGMDADLQRAIIDRLQHGSAREVRARLRYPSDSVARYFTHSCPVLTGRVTAGDALKRLENMTYRDGCMLYVVDDEHHLQGSLDITRLLNAGRNESLARLLPRQRHPQILISTPLFDVEQHEGWLNHRQLPVVDRNGIYMGELDYETVTVYGQQMRHRQQPTEAFSSLLSLAGVYWLSASWLLDCLLGRSTDGNSRSRK